MSGQNGCERVLEQLDWYLDKQPTGHSDQNLSEHLRSCSACAKELEVRKKMRERLKTAVESVATPPYLETRIRTRIQASQHSHSWAWQWVAVAAACAVCVGVVVAYQLGHLRLTAGSQESYISSVSTRVVTLMRVGLGDHIHCSVFRKFPKDPPKVEDLAAKLGPQYRGLIPIVRSKIPGDYRLMLAHQCSYHRRKFVHLSLKNGSQLISLVITRKGEGETFEAGDLLPALAQSGISFYNSGVQRFQIAAFESRDYVVYFISDLPQQKNTEMMLAVAPQVKDFLSRLETSGS